MSVACQEILAFAGAAIILMGIVCHYVVKETEVEYAYKVEALQATSDCEPCQLVILSKGNN